MPHFKVLSQDLTYELRRTIENLSQGSYLGCKLKLKPPKYEAGKLSNHPLYFLHSCMVCFPICEM
jgi:hypothetical protein